MSLMRALIDQAVDTHALNEELYMRELTAPV